MNHTLLPATLTIALLPSVAVAQLYPGNLVLASQNDVNAAAAYTGVTGNLTISGADIVDLGPLAGFTQVGGYISMTGNPLLTSVIDGFPSLTDVGGGMFFYNNDSLLQLAGFDALQQTGDNIDFWYNDVITSISGFASLRTAGWSLEFGDNPNLIEIPEFLSLQTISSSLFILDNPSLQAITGFQALQSVSWSFQIEDNTSLNELCGLYDYFSANNPYPGGGTFSILNNGPGLPNPTTIPDVLNAGPCPVRSFGQGCSGTFGPVVLGVTGVPLAGNTITSTSYNHAPSSLGFLVIGLSNTTYSGFGLPYSLDPMLGTSGCFLNVSIVVSLAGFSGAGSPARLQYLTALPPQGAGLQLHLQHACFEPVPGGLAVSNGVTVQVQ